MKTFALDLWQDLRDKRLWPVAILLAVALLAVPLLLRKPAEKSAASVSTASTAKPGDAQAKELAVKALQAGTIPPSKLDTFSAKNPFKPLVKQPSAQAASSSSSSSQSSQGSTGSSGGGTSSGGGGTTTGGGGGGGGTGNTGGNQGGGKTTTTQYTYVVDLTFTANDHTRHIKSMKKLAILPNESKPLLLFMGVDDTAGNAVFLVDSSLTASGEGKCKPSATQCAFAYVGPGSEEQFTNQDGDTYSVRIDEIRKVKLPTKGQAARSSKHPKAGAAVGNTAVRRFVPPVLADLVVVATGPADDSKTTTDGR
jgi:hypothetical protein